MIIAASFGGVFLSQDDGVTWSLKKNGFLDSNVYQVIIAGKNYFAGTEHGGVYKSIDFGETWKELNNKFSDQPVYSFAVKQNNIFAGTYGKGIFLTNNYGDTWVNRNNGLRDSIIIDIFIQGENIFISVENSGVYLSTDNGMNWIQKVNGLPSMSGIYASTTLEDCSSIAPGNFIICATLQGIYKSLDNGGNWILTTPPNIKSIVPLAVSGNKIFAGSTTYEGVFMSTDNGNTWFTKNTGLISKFIYSLHIHGNYIFAGTENGLFKAKLSEITSISEYPTENNSFQFYPNPAESNLTISINNNNPINKIEIIDLLGNKLKEFETPQQTTTMNIESLSRGVYFLRIGNDVKMFVKE